MIIKKWFITYLGKKEEGLITNDLFVTGDPEFKNIFPKKEPTEVDKNFFKLAKGKAGKKNDNWVFETKEVESAEDRIDNLESMVAAPEGREVELGPHPPAAKTKPKTTKKRGRPKQPEA